MKTNININITDIVIGILRQNTALSDTVKNRYVRIIAENGVLFPFITVKCLSAQPSRGNKDFKEGSATLQIQCLNNKYDLLQPQLVIDILDDLDIEVDNRTYHFVFNSYSEDWQDAYVYTLTFSVEME